MTAKAYIQSKGLEFKMQSGQIVLKECPFCKDSKFHFYVADTDSGAFFCQKCNEKGNLFSLKKFFGDLPQRRDTGNTRSNQQGGVMAAFPAKGRQTPALDEKTALRVNAALLADSKALAYVTETRGISLDTAKVYRLGLQVDGHGGRWLCIPHFEGGKLQNIKYRSLPPAEKTFRRVPGCKSILFNADCLKNTEEIFLCEGELDALTLIDKGINNAVSGTTGAGSFDAEWVDALAKVKKIYLAYDADEAGKKGAREVARRLGYDRCYNIELPDGLDVNEYFRENDIFDFRGLVNAARQYDVAGVMSFESGLDMLVKEKQNPQAAGLRTGFNPVDKLIKTGLRAGELIVLSAPPKIGKSTFSLQVCTNNALAGIPALFYSLEMRATKVIEKICQCYTWESEINTVSIEQTRRAFCGKPLYLGFCYQKPTLEGITETIKQAVRRYGLRLVVFDHLHYLTRSLTNQVQAIGLAVQAFKFLAEELELPVILIAQPRKIQADSIMTAMDLKDSSSIYSDCDHLVILHRKRKVSTGDAGGSIDTAFEPITLVRVEASRYNAGGETLLYYHGEQSRFSEIDNTS